MDPNEALRQVRAGMPSALNSRSPAISAMAEAFEGLDEWLTSGGFMPVDWSPKIGRPRLLEDGDVLDGVEHGKPRSYNKGCRCGLCRTANRERQAFLRAQNRPLPELEEA